MEKARDLCNDIIKDDVVEMFTEVFVHNIRRLEVHMVSPLHKDQQLSMKKAVLHEKKDFKLNGFVDMDLLKNKAQYHKDFFKLV